MIDTKAIYATVKANLARRNGCERHNFQEQAQYCLGEQLVCTACGTKMRISEIALYARGYRAAGGNPDDILKGALK